MTGRKVPYAIAGFLISIAAGLDIASADQTGWIQANEIK